MHSILNLSIILALSPVAVSFVPIHPTVRIRSPTNTKLLGVVEPLSAEEINERLKTQLEKMREKDKKSKQVNKEDIVVTYEDDSLVIVEKPAGVLCVSRDKEIATLSEAVYERVGCEMGSADKMVVHRLGMDTSGLMIFAKTKTAVRGMNSLFRTRKIHREYEALVCGHVERDESVIALPLMRDFQFPPYMRVSTDDQQRALLDLDPEDVGKKLLEAPKPSLTKVDVIAREELEEGLPITRVLLTSISGRTHQLNVHLAAIGHPIVGDTVYGLGGDAAPNGGMDEDDLAASRATIELQEKIGAKDMRMCVHARAVSFRHPVTRENLSFSSKAPF